VAAEIRIAASGNYSAMPAVSALSWTSESGRADALAFGTCRSEARNPNPGSGGQGAGFAAPSIVGAGGTAASAGNGGSTTGGAQSPDSFGGSGRELESLEATVDDTSDGSNSSRISYYPVRQSEAANAVLASVRCGLRSRNATANASCFPSKRGVANTLVGPSGGLTLGCDIPAAGGRRAEPGAQTGRAHTAGKCRVVLVRSFSGGSGSAYQPVVFKTFSASARASKALGDVWIDSVLDIGAYWRGLASDSYDFQ
jgi:hypothetical protein